MSRENYERDLFCRIDEAIKRHGLDRLSSSVILTGSFGRGEPTYTKTDSGETLKSDIEMAVVCRNTAKAAACLSPIKAEFEEDLNLMIFSERRVKNCRNFNFELCNPKYKTLFTYDLYNGSRTICGNDYLARFSLTTDDVDRYEAKRIVANRIGELVYTVVHGGDRNLWKCKLLLAMTSACLLLDGGYDSSYHAQYASAQKVRDRLDSIYGSGFFDNYEKAFMFLRENGAEFAPADADLVRYTGAARDYFAKNGLVQPKIRCAGRKLKYAIKYIKETKRFPTPKTEDNILSAVIDTFADCGEVNDAAELWHKVLY